MRFLLLLAPLALAACSSSPDAPASSPPTESPAPTSPVAAEAPAAESIEAFLSRFQDAVRRGDAEAVADLARFPLPTAMGDVPDRAAFVSEFYPTYLGEHDDSFRERVLRGTAGDLEPVEDGRYSYVSLIESCEENSPGDCFESAMIFYFAPDGETWVIDEVQFAG